MKANTVSRVKEETEKFVKFTLIENGQPLTRRVHSIIIQDRMGKIHYLVGELLPSSITLITGISQTGNHILEVLVYPGSLKGKDESDWADLKTWPVRRDVLHYIAGLLTFYAVRVTLNVMDVVLSEFSKTITTM